MADVRTVKLTDIRPNPVALRAVNIEGEKYLGIRDSVREFGILNPINGREKKDETTGETYYELCDGLHRFTAAGDVGLKEISINVLNFSDSKAMDAQIVANLMKVDTTPMEYTEALVRMFGASPTLTINEAAERLNVSPSWVSARLSLTKLEDSIKQLVDKGDIKIANAFQLAKLPHGEQAQFVDAAICQQPGEFTPNVAKRVKELREAARQGRAANPTEFTPVAHLRKMSEIKDERASHKLGPALVAQTGASTALDGFNLALDWVVNLDPNSAKAQLEAHQERQKAAEAAKLKRKAERDAKKAEEAAMAAAKSQELAASV